MEENNTTILLKTIASLLEGKKYTALREVLATMNPADIAALFEDLDEAMLPLIFRLLPKELAAEAFVEMDADLQEMLIQGFSDNELKEVLDELYLDDAVDIVEEMPANVVKRILANTHPETRKMINEILKYPEDSAGSIMTIEYVSLLPDMTAEEAILRIRRTGFDKETIYTCYVMADDRVLVGIVTVKDLLLAADDALIADIMDANPIFIHTWEDKEDVANKFNKYDFLAMPVVDDEQRLIGIVTVDDAIDVLQDEATEDIEKMAAISPSNDKPYLKTGVFELFRARIPWLLFLMISATFTGTILTRFEDSLAVVPALIAFIPMLMDTGGNSGGQSSVTIIRSLSLGDVEFRDIFRVIWKEMRVGMICGVTLAAANFVKILLIDRVAVPVALVVCLTLVVTVFVAKLIGCTLPLFAKKLGFDPAVMSSPFITTIVDAISLFVYLYIATAILGL